MIRESEWRNDPWLTLDSQTDFIEWKGNQFKIATPEADIDGVVHETVSSYWVFMHGNTYVVPKIEKNYDPDEAESSNVVRAPMTGTIIQIHVKEGSKVKKNDLLIEMEAMKMQYKIESPMDGLAEKILCKKQDIVGHDDILIELNPST